MSHSAFLTSAVAVFMAFSASWAYSATTEELMRMTDQLDQMDRLDFQAHLDKASQCARSRDLSCAETQLGKAAKFANGAKDKNSLASARESLLAVRKQIADEAAVLAERKAELERQVAEAKKRQRKEAEEEDERAERREKQQARRDAQEREDRQDREDRRSSRQADMSIGAYMQQKGAEMTSIMGNVDRQTNAAINAYNRELASKAAERARERAESNERAAEQRRDAQRDRNARVAQADTDRQQSQQRQQAEQDRARDRELIRQKQAKEEADRLVAEQNQAREQESNRQRQAKEKADRLAAQEAVRVAQVAGTMDAPDKKGCFVPVRQPECVVAEGRWAKGTSGQYLVRVTNNCRARVYVTLFHQKKDGTWNGGGADGIGAGRSHTFDAYDAAGRYEYVYTGSTNWQSDWVCGDQERDPVHAEELKRLRRR